jgi:hypothetical protein
MIGEAGAASDPAVSGRDIPLVRASSLVRGGNQGP